MKVDLSKLRIEFPERPNYDNDRRTDYRVECYFENEGVGHVTIARLNSCLAENDDFWAEKREEIWIPRSVVFFQETKLGFRGHGINGRLLVLANEETKRRYQMPLASSTNFLINELHNWEEHSFAEYPSMRVWEKLELEGLAYRKDYQGKPRWVMR
jgi:hypothetical protein